MEEGGVRIRCEEDRELVLVRGESAILQTAVREGREKNIYTVFFAFLYFYYFVCFLYLDFVYLDLLVSRLL